MTGPMQKIFISLIFLVITTFSASARYGGDEHGSACPYFLFTFLKIGVEKALIIIIICIPFIIKGRRNVKRIAGAILTAAIIIFALTVTIDSVSEGDCSVWGGFKDYPEYWSEYYLQRWHLKI